jgi:hypothetical protein
MSFWVFLNLYSFPTGISSGPEKHWIHLAIENITAKNMVHKRNQSTSSGAILSVHIPTLPPLSCCEALTLVSHMKIGMEFGKYLLLSSSK